LGRASRAPGIEEGSPEVKVGLVAAAVLEVLYWAIFARAVMSWMKVADTGSFRVVRQVLEDLTDPILLPIRKMIPSTGGFDLSPLLAMILVDMLRRIVIVAS
jgi:YggT family protein